MLKAEENVTMRGLTPNIAKCMVNVAANLALDLSPLGTVKSLFGVKVDMFDLDKGEANGPCNKGTAVDAAALESQRRFEKLGGDDKLNLYDKIAKGSGLGKGAKSARSMLSMFKGLAKKLPGIGDALDVYDAIKDAQNCKRKYG